MKPTISLTLIALLLHPLSAAVRGDHAEYVGGTVAELKRGTEGTLDISDQKELRFLYKDQQFGLPYSKIVSLEFGQKVGRRVGMATAGFLALGLPGLIILASKKKRHFLTIGYRNDAGDGQAAVFELAKGTISETIPALEARTGKRVEIEADEGFGEIGHSANIHVPPPIPVAIPNDPATVTVTSTPAGMPVIVDAIPASATPATLKLLKGEHLILIRKEGFQDWSQNITVKAGESLTFDAALKSIEAAPNVIVIRPSAPRE